VANLIHQTSDSVEFEPQTPYYRIVSCSHSLPLSPKV